MNILPVNSSKYWTNNYSSHKMQKKSPTFSGAISSSNSVEKVLNMLKNKASKVVELKDDYEVPAVLLSLIKKWDRMGLDAGNGIMIIPNSELPKFLGEEALSHDLRNKIGISLAVGDVNGPVETWHKCYESITVLLPRR